jgi:activator of 2-hydroxyglutaryl-CoA dehydratase
MLNYSTIRKYIGINIGSVSVNVVSSDDFGSISCMKKSHLGNPKKVLKEILDQYKNIDEVFYGVSGTLGDITEITAIERALISLEEKYDVILSLGGESFILYVLDSKGHISL